MADFFEYVVTELKSKRLSKQEALSLLEQFQRRGPLERSLLHPLLHENTSDLSEQSYRTRFSGEEFYLSDHRVRLEGQLHKVLPAVVYLEMARAAVERASGAVGAGQVLELRETVWLRPVRVDGERALSIALEAQSDGAVGYEIYSEEGAQDSVVHCQGRAVYVAEPAVGRVDVAALRGRCAAGRLTGEELYGRLEGMGLSYGAGHRAIEWLEQGAGELCARLSVPLSVQGEWQQYGLHPSLLDGALQACVGLLQEQSRAAQPWVPYAVEQVRAVRACAQQMWVWARWTAGGEGRSLDVELCDEQGAVCVQLRGFTARPLVAQSVQPVPAVEAPVGLLLARPVWRSSEALGGGEVYERRLVLLCELTQVQAQRLEGLLPGSECRELSAQGDVAQRYGEQAVQCFEQLREVLRSKPRGKVLVQVVAGQSERGGFSAGLTGLLRTAQQENPQLVGQVVMVEEGISEAQLAQRLSREPGAQVAAQVRYRGGEREVCGWQEEVLGGEGLPLVWKERGIYVLSGGLGGLGMLLARQVLSQTTQGQVVLVGRGELTESKRQQLAGLWPTAGRVHYRQADVADAQQVRELLEGVCREHGGLDGIVHGAGVKADNFIVKKTSEEFREVLRAKVQGVCNLDQASRALELDFLVLFSSVAGALGNVGQADYAAGNGFLDRYAEYRNELVRRGERHGRTVSINWPLWAEGGMQMEAASLEWLQRETGMRPLETPAGLQALQRALQLSAGQVLVLEGERERLRAALGLVRPAPALAAVAALAAVPAASSAAVSEPVSGNELLERTQEYLREQLAGQLHLAAHRIDPQAPLEQYGIDSILAMNLTRELERSFGTLSKTLFFEYRSVRELAGYFLQSHEARLRSLVMRPPAGEAPAGEVPVPVSVAQRAGRRRAGRGQGRVPESAAVAEPIAIIGLSGRYPQALNVQQYWENLKAGKDCITEVPAQRWDWREYYSENRSREGSHYSKWGGFIEGVDEFDPLFFNISPREAQALDPQERIFLQHAWMAVEDAGYTRQSLQIAQEQDLAGQVGVYVGVMYSEYQLYGAEAGVRGQRTAIAGSFASIANRVSYVLNLHGPSMTLDTMCSSSLTAIHVACQDLRLKRTQVAIAGGVNVSIHPAKYLMLSAGQFISSAGQCQSFGEGGDGYIPGEGAGAVVLKRLSQAQRDGDHIYGIIRGSALTHGGKTNGYTVPNPQAQSSAISRALREAQVDARHISYIEAHGTGTKLGDPIEIAALSAAFGQYTAERGFCLIGSAKSNIGHCESAAGIAGLTKVLLQMQHGQIVPSLHASSLNPHIDFPSTPFVVNQALRTWESPLIEGRAVGRIAGISSFGAGGSNAHMIVEEYREQALEPGHGQAPGEPLLIVLSARTPEQLQQKAQELLSCIGSQAAPRSLAAVAYTLQVGREAMQERLGLLAATRAELLEKLQGYVERGEQALQVYRGQAKRTQEGMGLLSQDEDMREAVGKWIARKKHAKLLELWVQGLEVPWSTLYGAQHPPLVSLPTYPFAKERYWISRAAEGGARFGALQLHPLLHENTSDLSEQSYRTRFSGEEFYLSDHRVRLEGQLHKVLPAVVYLEMARAAVERASGAVGAGQVLELRETVWLRPVRVDGERALSIALEAQADGAVGYEIYSEEGAQDSVVHCQGRAVYVAEPAVGRVDVAALRGRCAAGRLTGEELYGRLEGMGLSYGAGHRAIEWLEQGAGELCARLSVPLSVQGEWQQYGLHPSLLDGALQACVGLLQEQSRAAQPWVPYAVEQVRAVRACAQQMWVWARWTAGGEGRSLDVELCDEQGAVCVQLRGFTARPLVAQSAETDVVGAVPAASSAAVSEPVSGNELLERTQEYLREQLAGQLHLAAHRIDPQAPLEQYGIDSILAMNLTRELERSFGTLSKTLFFEYRSVRELAGYFLQSHEARLRSLVMRPPAGEAPAGEVPVPVSVAQRAGRRRAGRGQGRVPESAAVAEPIAIIGLSGRYPQALNVQQYWENLKAGKDCITEVPAQRWDWREYYSEDRSREGSHYSKWGGFIEGVDEFDPLFFNISPREAQALDPQERIFLQHAWMAVEDAGYTRQSLQIAQEQDLAGQVGVYVGVMYSEYQLYGAEAGVRGQRTAIAGSFASIANRVSYVLNLHGPSMTLDTMCSSSLTAIHVACQDLRLKRTQVAIAGGVNVSIHPAKYLMLSAGQFISSAGQCQSFGEGGDGYIPGEGAGAVVLKRLSQAQRDGDHIYGIIRGSALTHGGKTNGYTVPNPQAQSSAISRALREAQVDARHISYIEAHGTGTKLGDPIEIAALSAAFGQYTAERGFCLIGSAKSNIGHCESAAGIAGLTKVLLQMQHGQIVPSLHASSLNPHIDFPSTPFVVNQALRTWESPLIEGRAVGRIAGISSFGAGGSNAHMIVEEYREQALEPGHGQAPGEPLLIVLSARTPEQLQQKAQELLSCIGSQAAPRSLAAVAYTLQVGREAMQERLGLLAATRAELLEKLQGYVERGEQALQVYRGQAKRTQEGMGLLSQDEDMREAVGKWIARKKHAKLLELWVQGLEVPWSTLYGAQHPPLVSLPTYPFAKERYWISRAAEGGARFGALQLHPLLHENTSDLSEQSYRTRFSGEEFYLSDHRVRLEGQLHKVLPAVVYLEMARAAVERASGAVGAGQVLELRETVWLRPVRVDGERALSIALEAQADGAVGYEIYSEEGAQDSVVHCQGRAVYVAEPAVGRVDVAALRGRCAAGRLTGEELYGRLEGMGLSYGAGHRAIEWLEQGAGELCARLSVPLSVQGEWQQYGLHPSLLDGALQACVGLLQEQSRAAQPWVPYAVEQVRAVRACAQQMWVWARWTAGGEGRSLDVELCDEQGAVCVQLRGFTARPLVAQSVQPVPAVEAPVGLLLARPVWRSSEALGGGEVYERRLVLLCELTQVQAQRLEGLLPGSECRELSAQGDVAQRYGEQAVQCFEQLREVLRSKPRGKVLVQVVAGQSERGGFSAGLTGLLRTAQQENPQLVGQVVMVEEGISEAQLAQRLSREPGAQVAAQVRYRGGEREVCGWQEEVLGGEGLPLVWKERGIYVLSGGLGGLGMLLARQVLSQTTQGQVVLVGRGELTESKRQQLAGLWPTAGRVHYRQADVADAQQVRELLEGVCREHGGLDGIVHGAGVKADNFIVKKTSEEFREVLRAKVQGVCNLDQASRALELDFLVLFSSVAGALGNVGQADYAAGNGFLDRYAEYRNELVRRGERHGRTVSINWPLWAEGGMQMEAASLEWLQRETGMRPLETPAGLQALQRALQLSAGQVLVLEGERERLRAALGLVRPAPALAAVAALAAVPAASSAAVSEPVSGNELLERTQEYLREQLAGQLHLAAHRIDPQAPLEQYGIDSILAMNLTRELERSFGTLSKTLFFEYRSVRELAGYFVKTHPTVIRDLCGEPTAVAQTASAPLPLAKAASRGRRRAAARSHQEQPIAIVGISGKYPQSEGLAAFWENLKNGTDCITEIPAERWDHTKFYDVDKNKRGKSYGKWGGFMPGVDQFDPLFFGITPREAELIDPQERLFLETSWQAIEDAGYDKQTIAGQRIGVYVGVMWTQYELLGLESAMLGNSAVPSSSHASIANRVSYFFDFHGPSIAIDTMCSSSLTAIHLACEALRAGQIDAALAGGVNLSIHPQKYLGLSQGRYLASDGRCRSFGAGGDGYVPGEGVGTVMLKPLEHALRDNDQIHAVIKASAINHGGKTHGYSVPNPNSQGALIRDVFKRASVDPGDIGYIEAHGTGTSLGDPIEISGLMQAFDGRRQPQSCPIGSVKSNIGHLEAAAGVAALTKVVLQMKHRQLVPSLHATPTNPHIDFSLSPFYVQRELQEWTTPDARPRLACVSSFGAGGSNGHLIVQEHQDACVATDNGPSQEPQLFLLSARDTESLERYAYVMADFLSNAAGCSLDSVAYTSQVGRMAFDVRLAVIASTLEELQNKITEWLAVRSSNASEAVGASELSGVFHGNARSNRQHAAELIEGSLGDTFIDELLQRNKLTSLARFWLLGVNIAWARLRRRGDVRRISLPTYPFARERYWLKTAAAQVERAPTVPAPEALNVEPNALARDLEHYRPHWQDCPIALQATAASAGKTLLILAASEALFLAIKTLQRNSSVPTRAVLARWGDRFEQCSEDVFIINPECKEDFQRLMTGVHAAHGLPTRIIHACGQPAALHDAQRLTRGLNEGIYSALHVCQALMELRPDEDIRMISLYGGDTPFAAPESAALGGFHRVLALENPRFAAKTVHVQDPPGAPPLAIDMLAQLALDELGTLEWNGNPTRYEVATADDAVRHVRYVRSLVPFAAPERAATRLPLKPQGTYVITGGLGGLGLVFAEYLARTCQAQLVLVGRSELTAAHAAKIARLETLGAQVHYVRADMALPGQAEAVVNESKARFTAIDGVIHAAGVNRDSFILRKTRVEMAAVLAAKVHGTVNLDQAMRNERLDWFVLFSSAAAELGNVGQCDYAYGNHFMDYFAENRERQRTLLERSGRTYSINWPFWEQGGMTIPKEEVALLERRTGLCPMPTAEGMRAWELILRTESSRTLVLYGVRPRIEANLAGLSADVSRKPVRVAPVDDAQALLERTRQYLRTLIGNEINLAPERLDPSQRLASYGIESVLIMQLNARLENDFGALPKTLFYEQESIDELARYLLREKHTELSNLLRESRAQPASAESVTPAATGWSPAPAAPGAASAPHDLDEQAIAIIGLSGRYPGAADLHEFWQNLRQGRESVELVPDDRWNREYYYDSDPAAASLGKIYCRWGGFLEDQDKFDPSFFNISPAEARAMDPQERLFLQSVWAAIEDAGYTRESLRARFPKGRNAAVGVFVGVTTSTYNLLGSSEPDEDSISPAAYPWSIANRVSYIFDFEGPSMPIDTACSSSLVAVHLACESIRRNECRLAVVGGVNLYLHPAKYQSMCRRRMLSSDGKCRSYGAGEEGFVPGEGVGTLILKPLSSAMKDRDHIYGVIRGSAYAHSGRSNGYSAPNPNSQATIIDETLRKAGVHPESIGYVEGHGTGTRMGDSLEILALTQAFHRQTDRHHFCALGSVKPNIGHSESAAGVAAITKVLLQMKNHELVPLISAEEVNPDIDFDNSPFYLQRTGAPWSPSGGTPRRALINAFGGGGVNACVILEEMAAREVPIDAAPVSEQLFVLSARTPSQLREYAARLRAFLCREPGVDLRALCYTLQVGREAMRERLAIVVSRHSELLDKLDDRLWSSAGKEGLYVGTASTATKAPTEAEKSLEILAERWVHGVAADWESLYEVEPGRLSLPTYPFSKERFWVSDTPLAEVRPTLEHRSSALHPLVSNNSSTLTDVSFSSRLSDTAFYAADHRVNGEKIFPGAGFLEIAGICGSLAAEQNVCKIRDIVWMNPLSFQGGPQTLRTHLKRIGDDVEYAITSLGDDNEPLVHTEGRLAFLRDGDGAGSVEKTLPLARLRELCSEFRTGDDLYSSLAAQGFVYGAGLRVVRELQTSESSVLARLQLPESLRAEFGEFLLHPALIDGALQTVAALLSTARPHRSYLPFALDEIDIVRPMTQACYAFVEDLQAGKTGNAPTRRFNVTLVDDLGDVLVSLRNLHMMPLDEIAMGHGQPAML